MKDLYPIIKIESKDEIEQLGTKEKYWVYDAQTKEKKLFKIGRENTGENWAEVVAYEIGKHIGMEVAKYEFAFYNSKQGTISTSFVQNDERLIHGNELLIKIDKSYPLDRFYKVREYTLDTVLSLLKILERAENIKIQGALDSFIGYVVFDCLIANQDRHHENWGLIAGRQKKLRLALSFDHASGFGCWVDKIVQAEDSFYKEIFEKIPDEFINEYSKEFALEILKENTKRLEALKYEVCKNG